MAKIFSRSKKAFTLVEVIVDFGIITMVFAAVATAYLAGFKSIALAKAKIAAVAEANAQMENLRNMPYDDLATQNGSIYPPGTILDTQTVTRNGIELSVATVISYLDDPFDGDAEGTIPNKPTDIYPYDYKKIEVSVRRAGSTGVLARLTSSVAAKAAETPTNTGIIKVCVFDASNNAVIEAILTIQNSETAPPVNITTTTDTTGCAMIPALPPDSHNHYHLQVTKNGYSTDMTYPRTPQNPNALQPDVDIILQQVTKQTFKIDKLSTLTVDVKDQSGTAVANTAVHIIGSKLKWFNPNTPKFDQTVMTDATGHINLPNMEFDSYTVTVNGWQVAATAPYQPVVLSPDTTLNVAVTVTQDAAMPRITGITPLKGIRGECPSLTITGANFSQDTVVKLVKDGMEITGTGVSVNGNDLDVDVDLTNANTGWWDILITNPDGRSVRQVNGFEVGT